MKEVLPTRDNDRNLRTFNVSDDSEVNAFRSHVYSFFSENGRMLPWRTDYNPYHIFISEVMLQQTQVDRVGPKFITFVSKFPDFLSLSNSGLEDVYSVWQGLGYNRRAAALRNAAKMIIDKFNGKLPDSPEDLVQLPGIGPATANSICAFAFNKPVIFLETNIRTVLIWHFFRGQELVSDEVLFATAATVIDHKHPRKWYSALMDYGTMLKKNYGNISQKSATYKKQTPFQGSRRQIRGVVLKTILEHRRLTLDNLSKLTEYNELLLSEIITDLVNEKSIKETRYGYELGD